jgi:putative GTP pyrophosphokinase
MGDNMIEMNELFNWELFLQPYELAVEDFILKIEGIKNQYHKANLYCPIEIVSGRVKSPQSILDKARRMNVPAALIDEKVHDIGGIRITCKYIDDVYKVAELVKNRRDLEVLEVRDYIKKVKPSGYRSYHIICRYIVETIRGAIPVLLEFQIRTHAMHFWASIEHSLKYKYQKRIPVELKERLTAAAHAAEKLDEEMTAIRLTIEQLDVTFGEDKSKVADPLENEVSINHKKW